MIREVGSGRVEGLGEIRPRPGRTKASAVCDGTVRQLQNGLTAYFEYDNQGWVGEGTSCLNGYFFPKPPVKPDVIVSHHPAFSVLPR